MQVAKWGNSLAIRIPASVVEALGLNHAVGARDLEIERQPDTGELLARLRKFRGKLPDDFRFDRLAATENKK